MGVKPCSAQHRVFVGVGESQALRGPTRISTYGIGSCVGICLVAQTLGVVGLLHAQLPLSKRFRERAQAQPGLFVDTGMRELYRKLHRLDVTPRDLRAFLVGGAQMGEGIGREIGPSNVRVARRMLWRQDIPIEREEVGGGAARTVHLSIPPFSLEITSPGGVRTQVV